MNTMRRSTRSRRMSSSRGAAKTSRRAIRPASAVKGRSATSRARRKLAAGAQKVSPQLNRVIAGR
jgi:hypothetical protein